MTPAEKDRFRTFLGAVVGAVIGVTIYTAIRGELLVTSSKDAYYDFISFLFTWNVVLGIPAMIVLLAVIARRLKK